MSTGTDKITILVFDCWLPGFIYIKDLATDFKNVSLVFVHTSSLQMGDPARDYEAFQKQYDIPEWVHDFSDFNYDFDALFDKVKPDAVVVLSLHHIETRTGLLFASRRGVPTYMIPHGIFFIQESPPTDNAEKNNISRFRYLISKIPRIAYYSKFFWRFHFQSVRGRRKGASFSLALKCYKELISGYFFWQWRPSIDVQKYYMEVVDHLILYDKMLYEYYAKHYGAIVAGAALTISGTLDLGRIAREAQSKGEGEAAAQRQHRAYYISSPYTEHFTKENTEIYGDFVRKIKCFVSGAGFDTFVYRPHPGEPLDFTSRVCEIAGAELDRRRDLSGLAVSDLICGTGSSLLYCAVILNKPIVIADTKKLKIDLPYYEPLTSYPTVFFDADTDIASEANSGALDLLKTREAESVTIDISQIADPLADLIGIIRRETGSRNQTLGDAPRRG